MDSDKMGLAKYLWIFSILFIMVFSFVVVVDVDRIAWFDEAFSLETARILNEEGSIDFRQHDVHGPVYYWTLAVWQARDPGVLSETQHARFLSVIFMFFFLLFVYLLILELKYSEFVAAVVMFMLSVSTTLVHYGTEIRMYAMLMLFSVAAVYFAVRWIMRSDARYSLFISSLFVMVLPFIHYFGVIIGAFILAIILMLWKTLLPLKGTVFRRIFYTNIVYFVFAYGVSTFFAVQLAFLQKARITNMWFDYSSIWSYPSSLIFGFHYTEGFTSYFVSLLLSLFQLVLIVWVLFYFGRLLFKKFDYSRRAIIMVMMMLTVLLPLLMLVASHYFLGLYHHRFMLVVLWMFVVASLTYFASYLEFSFKRRKFGTLFVLLVLLVAYLVMGVLAQQEYVDKTSRVQENAFRAIPCEGIALHETPFTYVPHVVWDRQEGCDRVYVLGTLLSWSEGRSSGFDVIDDANIIYFDGEHQYEVDSLTYYFTGYHYFLLVPESDGFLVYNGTQLLLNVGVSDWLSVLRLIPDSLREYTVLVEVT